MRAILLAGALLLVACGGGTGGDNGADTLTRRERDSIIGASGLPGARGVQKALEAADTAAARRARLDSMAGR